MVVEDLYKLRQQGFSTKFPLPTLTKLVFITCRYLIPNDWNQISIWMRLLQNLLTSDNVWVFWKFIYELEAFSYSVRMGLSLAKQLMSLQKMSVSSAKFTILISWSPVCTPLIPCHYHWNWCQSWLQQQTETWRVGNPAKLPTWWGYRGQRGKHSFLFLDWILFCTVHIRQIKFSWKSRNGNKKFQVTLSKALAEFH